MRTLERPEARLTERAATPTNGLLRRPLRVVMLIHTFYPHVGGAETNLKALVPPLKRRAVEVAVLTRRLPNTTLRASVDGAAVFRLPVAGPRLAASLAYTLHSLRWLARNRRRVDLLHAHNLLSPGTSAALGKLLFGKPVVAIVLRGGALGDVAVLSREPLGRLRQRLLNRLVDAYVAVSSEIVADLQAAGVPPERIVQIPYGVDTERFRPLPPDRRAALRAELGLEGRAVALHVGRLVSQKGLPVLLEAWPRVRAAVPNALLLLAGDGPERAALEARGEPNVRFLGTVMEPAPLLQAADCFVQPSYSEGLSNALLEALSAGLPTVATAIGGTTDAVRDGIEGLLVPPGDAEALAEALVRALTGQERARLGAAARARALERYSIESNAERLRQVYDRLVGAAAAP